MKRFLATLLIWLLISVVFTFFFAAYFFSAQHAYRLAVLAAIVFAVITHAFEWMAERIQSLEQRVERLEKEKKSFIES